MKNRDAQLRLPERLAGVTAGEVEMKRTGQLTKVRTELDRAESQGVELDPGSVADGLDQPGTKGIQQAVGRGVHQRPGGQPVNSRHTSFMSRPMNNPGCLNDYARRRAYSKGLTPT